MDKKTSDLLASIQKVRGTWSINPKTRVHDNDTRKNKKKVRREGKASLQKALKDY